MSRPLRILIVEDQAADADLVVRELRRAGFSPEWKRVQTEAEFTAALHPDLDVILSDFDLPAFSGMRALEVLNQRELAIPFILVSGTIGEDTAVAAMNQGAADYLLKDRLARIGPAVERALENRRMALERRRAEESLRESERRFREMLGNLGLIAMTLDLNGTITFCNDYLLRVTGWTRREVEGANWFTKFAPGNLGLKQLFVSSIEKGTIPAHHENPIQARDGTLLDIAWSNTLLRDPSGNITGTASIGEDVTERKRIEERVREQAAMLDRAAEAIIVRDIHTRRITFWNRGAERLYGWTATEAIGCDIADLIFMEPEAIAAVTERLLTDGEWRGEHRHVAKDGKRLVVSGHATRVCDASGQPKSALVINFDVTAQKAMEAQFLRAQRMESIGTLASGVAHDLNNILSPILMSVSMLRRQLSPEQRETIISTIEASATRGAQIVKQVLTFGRGLDGERQPLRIEAVIKELAKILHGTFPKSIMVETAVAPDLWLVIGDATQIHQVLLNLFVNARDAMPEGGRLRIRATNRQLDAAYASMLADVKPGPHVLLEVEDTGTGIPAEIVERIFDPFFTTKGVGQGTGLGLSTVLGIVKSHGGAIQVKSEPGKGSHFHVYLPAAPECDGAVAGESRAAVRTGNGELVLLVDDEAGVRDTARLALESAGYRVLVAAEGTEALVIFATRSAEIAVVLTDMMMPYMDGLALIRALRAMAPDLPIIASTGLEEKSQLAALQALDGINVLHKPFGADTLSQSIHDALRVRRKGVTV